MLYFLEVRKKISGYFRSWHAKSKYKVLCGATATEHDKTLKLNSIQLRSALLKGHKRFSLNGEDYPAVIYTGEDQDSVIGILCQGLELKDINALDCFEGEVLDFFFEKKKKKTN
ncbi:hypothetical protein BD408DRAFT_355389 [Parasitella parasitica]|nr:hypothetical protein BD408DRAFT_355389 [Parasitella parasitica]